MSEFTDCRGMEQLYRERAKADPKNSSKWLGQADRWRELAERERAWRSQRRATHQQMHAGTMAVGSNTVRGDSRSKQQG
jgi:hypothetical protein